MSETATAPATEGPALVCPVPRRPLTLDVASPVPAGDESFPGTPSITAHDLRFLDRRWNTSFGGDSRAVSRQASLRDLTAPTLFGIYSPTAGQDPSYHDRAWPASPWGPGAQTPSRPWVMDAETAETEPPPRCAWKGESLHTVHRPAGPASASSLVSMPAAYGGQVARASSVVVRTLLLFVLGVGYGALVMQLPSRRNTVAGIVGDASGTGIPGWGCLVFWGMAGLTWGRLLPWLDGVRQGRGNRDVRTSSTGGTAATPSRIPAGRPRAKAGGAPNWSAGPNDLRRSADWALIVRGVGAFVGFVLAIRRLAWVSTLQVSLALALANSCLWYIVDRSCQGFVLATVTGLAGSAVLMALNPAMVPAPTGLLGTWASGAPWNGTVRPSGWGHGAGWAAARAGHAGAAVPSQGLIETAIWVVSVLFCSCVCFGNIGRRLAME